LCHTNEYIHLQKNYNSPKGLNPDFQDSRISRIISKPVGARFALALVPKCFYTPVQVRREGSKCFYTPVQAAGRVQNDFTLKNKEKMP
jgi:hypothetical protein